MPALALSRPASAPSRSASRAVGGDGLPMHLSAIAAAELERLLGGREGRMTPAQRPALQALQLNRSQDADLRELLDALDRDGEIWLQFL